MNWFKIVILAELLVIVTLSAWLCRPKETTDFENLENYHQVLQHEIDSLIQINQNLDKEVTRLNTTADSLYKAAQITKNNIQILKNNRNERINAIDNFGHDELVGFFSELQLRTEDTDH
ncbi:hypothetical protein JMN32_00105 [Fulvivirga sp. 29W222]|uniref:Uncharacterized protein n=1 Tax=Fulvivirga marina TaxID=2494733 RepID=A0A937FSW1_9BACT|nr:hypothetical protein [Fulvivirga marina]MBL6444689.1 hypothetical protein [Fulvivirga marina]